MHPASHLAPAAEGTDEGIMWHCAVAHQTQGASRGGPGITFSCEKRNSGQEFEFSPVFGSERGWSYLARGYAATLTPVRHSAVVFRSGGSGLRNDTAQEYA
jgi:hypothetical protein